MSRDGSIRLHPKHGLNPTMPVCGWCNQPTGEIALLGAAYKGEAPMHLRLNDEPCAKCKELMALGITFIERTLEGSGARTGRWCVLKREAVVRMLEGWSGLPEVLEKGACNVTREVSDRWGLFPEPEEGSK